jgi:hypothetical protein
MKKVVVSAIIIFCCVAATAQTNLKKKIVDSTCACLNTIPDISKKTAEELQMLLSQCMMQKSMEDVMGLVMERGIEMTDMEGMQKLMIEISADLAKSDCDALKNMTMRMGVGSAPAGGNNSPVPAVSITGAVQKVETKDFVYITVLSGAKSIQLVWSDYVANGDDYAKDFTKLKSKNLQFYFVSKDVYSPAAKAYINVKMITEIK